MSRAERLHHEKRIKAKWRRRIKNMWYVRGLDDKWVRETAARKAHHPCCPCWMCQHPTGENHRVPKPAERRALPSRGERGGKGR